MCCIGYISGKLTHCILNRLSHTIYWKCPISILGTPGYILREKWLNYLQTVETLIRCRVLHRLIWVCTVCQLPFYRSPNCKGLRDLWRQTLYKDPDKRHIQINIFLISPRKDTLSPFVDTPTLEVPHNICFRGAMIHHDQCIMIVTAMIRVFPQCLKMRV